MYEENRTGFALKDILLQIILVVIFVFLLLWLFPTKGYIDKKLESIDGTNLEPLYQELFNQHLETMKDAAQSYYTTARLPKKVGDKVSLTLGEMLNKKLISSFVDSNNKQCSLNDSYVEITKMDDEYMMKVNLNCSDKSDYIIVYMGCYNYCEADLCEKEETTTTKPSTNKKPAQTANKTYQYEYELISNGKYGDWSKWSNWSTNKVTGSDYKQIETKKEWQVIGTERVKSGTKTTYVSAEPITTSKTYSTTTSIVCPTGYKRYNSNSKTSKLCIADPISIGTSGTQTTVTEYVDSIKTEVKVCPDGRVTTNDWCFAYGTKQDVKPATATTVYGDWVYVGRKTYNGSKLTTDTEKYVYVSSKDDFACSTSTNCSKVTKNTYDVYTKASSIEYSCAAYPGYTLSGSNCVKSVSDVTSVYGTWTVQTKETCENGTTPVNGKCAVTKTVNTPSTSTKCPGSGSYDANAGWCYTRGAETTTCKSGVDGKIVDGKCVVETTKYVCDEGTLVGSRCKITTNTYKTQNEYGYVTYYRYRTREYISGTKKTAWSSSQNDKSLLDKGYTLTGNKKQVTKA